MIAIPAAMMVAATAFGVMQQQQAGKAQEQQLKQQSELAETRAIQKDLERRQELDRVQSAIKAARASRGGSLVSPLTQEFLNEANETLGSERLRAFAAERQQAANFRSAAAASRRQRRLALIGGGLKMGASLFQAGMDAFGGGGAASEIGSGSSVPGAFNFTGGLGSGMGSF